MAHTNHLRYFMKRHSISSFLLSQYVLYLYRDNMKYINNYLTKYIISLVIAVIITIFLSYLIISNISQNQIKTIYNTSNLIVELNQDINRDLLKLTDIDGLNTSKNIINITNTSKEEIKYKIFLTGLTSDADYIRISLNNNLIRNLSNYTQEGNSYILGEFSIPSNYSAFYNISL